ncbi:MAG: hypothetical protein AB9891_09555 [Anaerolineaceae bacterium]
MKTRMFKFLIIFLITTELFGCAGAPPKTVQPTPETSTPSPAPSPDHFKYTAGIYTGDEPEITFWLSEDGQFSFKRFQVAITDESGFSGPCGALQYWEGEDYSSSFNEDGSFVVENKDAGVLINGIITGGSAQGKYNIEDCGPGYDYTTPQPQNGTWTASWFATPTPMPTPLPPVNGHFAGENVSFDISDAEGNNKQVRNFHLQVNNGSKTCTFSQNGEWLLDSGGGIAAYFNYVVVSFHVSNKSASGGFSQTDCGGGRWSAIWVNP